MRDFFPDNISTLALDIPEQRTGICQRLDVRVENLHRRAVTSVDVFDWSVG